MKTDVKRDLITEEKTWEEIKACREKFEGETKRENILRVLLDQGSLSSTLTADLQFISTDEETL